MVFRTIRGDSLLQFVYWSRLSLVGISVLYFMKKKFSVVLNQFASMEVIHCPDCVLVSFEFGRNFSFLFYVRNFFLVLNQFASMEVIHCFSLCFGVV